MVAFEFIPIIAEGEPGLSQLAPGHIIVTGAQGECSSRSGDAVPMLLVSVSDLMSGLCSYLTSNRDKLYVFAATEGGFRFKVVKLKSGLLRLSCQSDKQVIAETSPEELRVAVWTAVRPLYALYVSTFDAAVPAQGDLSEMEASGLEEWELVLNEWQSAFPELPDYRGNRPTL